MKDIKLITHQDYCRAKNQSGNAHLDKVLPPDTRKLFPFKYFTNFSQMVIKYYKSKKVQVRNIAPLICGSCGDNLAEQGNGEYYCAYIVFISQDQFYPACDQCHKEIEYDYEDQVYGIPTPLFFPECFAGSLEHNLVWYEFLRWKRYEYAKDLISVARYKEVSREYGGGTWDGIPDKGAAWAAVNNGVLTLSDQNHKLILKLSHAQAVKCINEIIEANQGGKPNHIIKPDYVQASLF